MHAYVAAFLCAALGTLAPLAAAAQVPDRANLYELGPGAATPVEGVLGVLNKQRIELRHVDALHDLLRGGATGRQLPVVTLPLGPGIAATVALESVTAVGRADFFLVSGRVIAPQVGQALLRISAGTLDARLTVGRAHYQVRGFGVEHYLLEVNPGVLPPEAPPTFPWPVPMQGDDDDTHGHDPVNCDSGEPEPIRVLVLYTKAALQGAEDAAEVIAAGSTAPADPALEIVKAVQQALGWANAALENSGASTRFSAAIEAQEIATGYFETGDGGKVLAHLYAPEHPLHKAARQQRDDHEADLVTLVIEHWDYCGAAPVMIDWNTHPEQTAYSVVRRACLDIDHQSLGHELGHSMGSAHDRGNARVPGLFTFSYGYNEPDGKLSTLMAYACAGCERRPNYSNPNGKFDSEGSGPSYATGCPESPPDPDCRPTNNVRSLDLAACRVAAWR